MIIKECSKCKVRKPQDHFYKGKSKGSFSGKCKDCTKKDVKNNRLKVGTGYDFSEKGVIRVLYKTQKRNNKLRGFGDMPYSNVDFTTWLYENNYKSLYDTWVLGGNIKNYKPSVDRLDDFVGYTLDNIRLVTWIENKQHQWKDIITGEGTSGERCKSVVQCNLQGNVLREFISYQEIRRVMGYCVNYVVLHKDGIKDGYLWKVK